MVDKQTALKYLNEFDQKKPKLNLATVGVTFSNKSEKVLEQKINQENQQYTKAEEQNYKNYIQSWIRVLDGRENYTAAQARVSNGRQNALNSFT